MTTPTASETLGYEERRDQLEAFVERHYIRAFGLKPCSMVDLGCGDGFWTQIFAERGYTVVGVDRNQAAIEHARQRAKARYAFASPSAFLVLDIDDPVQLDALAAGASKAGAPHLIFARTLPHFYQPTLEPGQRLLEQLLRNVANDETLILISVYSDQTLRTVDGATHHHLADLVQMAIRAGGTVTGAQSRDDYLQIGVTR